jgi:integrase
VGFVFEQCGQHGQHGQPPDRAPASDRATKPACELAEQRDPILAAVIDAVRLTAGPAWRAVGAQVGGGRTCGREGASPHLHFLRHLVATQLASAGYVSARTLAPRLGHADATISLMVYSVFWPPSGLEAAEHVGPVLNLGVII